MATPGRRAGTKRSAGGRRPTGRAGSTGHDLGHRRLVGVYSEPDIDVTYPSGDLVQQYIGAFEADTASPPAGIQNLTALPRTPASTSDRERLKKWLG